MKRGITLLAVVATPFVASAEMKMPTLYGKVNKAYTYTDADKVEGMTQRKTGRGVTDVANSESRIGVKGSHKLDKMTVGYKIELGLNSTHDSSAGRVRIRHAKATLKNKMGKLTVGQTFTPMAKLARSVDPLSSTVAGFQGNDINASIDNAQTELGFEDRSRKDLLAYTTPNLHGFTYTVSTDRNNANSNDSTDSSNYDATHWEHLAQYQRDFGGLDLGLYVGYRKADETGYGDITNTLYGANFGFGAFGLNVGMSSAETEKKGSTTVKEEIDRMFAALTFERNKNKFAFTYQTREDKNQGNVDGTDRDYTQMSLGMIHQCNKYVSLNTIVTKFETEDTSTTKNKANEADATQVAFGIQVKF